MSKQNPNSIEPHAAAPGVLKLEGSAARLQLVFASLVLVVPLLGTIEAGRLIWVTEIPAWAWWLFGVMYFVHMFGVTAGLHRLATHTGFKTSETMKMLLTIMGSMAAQGPLYYWVSQHRRHHLYSDQKGDPHSPNLHENKWLGLWYSHMPWMLSKHVSTWSHYAKDTLRDPVYFFVHRYYLAWVLLGLLIPTVIGALITQTFHGAWIGFIFGGLARMFFANQSAWMVGSISHRYGSVNFDTKDNSKNNWIVALLAFGEGLQNNHHAFPINYRHAVYWYEPDLTGWILALMNKLGLVWDLKFPNQSSINKLSLKKDKV
ncbi:acyl-CoA desaturase [Alteromonas sp. a30]|uniref:acyl-CoA desaturase n=1 Tax=Alteromonas sp. a30 TaxID=2730917 RepID=UPI002282019C|nr:acyl-CoA desaturase [Alteromonas sp. a30]MCY7294073.1 acyl-CoA desaturase [Alteromonas sp. a30]